MQEMFNKDLEEIKNSQQVIHSAVTEIKNTGEGISTLFSIVAVLACIPTNSVRGVPFLHTLSSIYCL